MDWLRSSSVAIVSEDRRYSVCRIGSPERAMYEAWRTRHHPAGAGLIATGLHSADVARQRCVDDERSLVAAAVQRPDELTTLSRVRSTT